MVNSIYYYRYSKFNKTVNFVKSNITVEPTRKSENNSLFYYTYSYDTPEEALIDIMEYINKHDIKDTIFGEIVDIKDFTSSIPKAI